MHRKHLLPFVFVIVASLVLNACQTQTPAPTEEPAAPSEPTQAPAATEAPTEAAAAPTEAAPAEEETVFTFAHSGPILTMDAPVTWELSTHWLANLLYDCLIWRAADGSGYVGQAAETWERTDDTTWVFHLRPNLTFHNGEVLDAEAVAWNLNRVMTREDFQVYPQWQFISEVNVLDPQTIEVKTDGPVAFTEFYISFNGCELLPPKYMEEVGEEEFALHPVGSGPYMLETFTTNERYEFVAWDGYWAGRPEVDRVVYQVIPEPSSQVAALLAGQIDMVANVPQPDLASVESAPGIEVMSATSGKLSHYRARAQVETGDMAATYPGYNPTTLDVRIRQAISHALDRKTLAEIQGSAVPRLIRVSRVWPAGQVGQWATEQTAIDYYDPDLARQLIAEAGYDPDAGNKPKIYLDAPANDVGNEKDVAEAMEIMLEEVGFDVELNILDLAAYMEQVYVPGNNRELTQINLGGSAEFTPFYYTCEWVEPAYTVCNQDWEKVSQQILVEVDEQKRLALWEQWWDFYVEDANTITLFEIDSSIAINEKFQWTPRADGWFTFRDLTLR
jgi:peptide/nickel transport system substrate-binding protein